MENQNFEDFIRYIERLAEIHSSINHNKDGVKHFTRLDTDELDTSLQSRVGFPVLCLDRYSANLKGEGNNFQKSRGITLMFLDHVSDPKNYNRIHEVWNRTENIADDFVRKIYNDIQKGLAPELFDMNLSSVEYELAANKSLQLYGVIVTFPVLTKFRCRPTPGSFD